MTEVWQGPTPRVRFRGVSFLFSPRVHFNKVSVNGELTIDKQGGTMPMYIKFCKLLAGKTSSRQDIYLNLLVGGEGGGS